MGAELDGEEGSEVTVSTNMGDEEGFGGGLEARGGIGVTECVEIGGLEGSSEEKGRVEGTG